VNASGPDAVPPAPGLFSEVVGQPSAVGALRAAARHPVHAYLLCGPHGTGRRAAARAFAAALLCASGGCGECATCRRALAGTHPDLVVVERTGSSLAAEDARRLVGLAQRRPLEGSRQVLVVADVHLAGRVAPALLKTVEEPPASTVFVLLADSVPPDLVTVASRCVQIDFPPVPAVEVARWLVATGTDPGRATLVAEGAGGDLDRARLLATDEGFVARLELWRAVPSRLDGHGATAGALARQLLEGAESALEPLRVRHAAELAALDAEAESMGERSAAGRKELTERQHREERRWRTAELRTGLGVLARTYRDRLAGAAATNGPGTTEAALGCEAAISLVNAASASLKRNPNETLLLEALLTRLGRVGA
jgi:DNA polymerase-3 subunit delta'